MNKTQLDYALHRVDTMLSEKVQQIAAEHTKPAQTITDTERANLLRAGKVKLRSDVTTVSTYTDVVNVFDFSKFAWGNTVDDKTVYRLSKPFREQAQKLKDKIMLGDEAAAMDALEAFALKCGSDPK